MSMVVFLDSALPLLAIMGSFFLVIVALLVRVWMLHKKIRNLTRLLRVATQEQAKD